MDRNLVEEFAKSVDKTKVQEFYQIQCLIKKSNDYGKDYWN